MAGVKALAGTLVIVAALWPALAAARQDEPELTVDPQAEQTLLDLGGPGFRIKRTDHFVIAYNTSDETLRSLVSRVEATYQAIRRLCKINAVDTDWPTTRLHVIFFDDYEAYGTYAAASDFNHIGSAGFYNQQNNVAAFVNVMRMPELRTLNAEIQQSEARIEQLKKARPVNRQKLTAEIRRRAHLTNRRDRIVERVNRVAVQHETAHQIFFNIGVHVFGAENPGWLVEGLACLFETPPSESGAGLGATNQMRLEDFRRCLTNGPPNARIKPEAYQTALASGAFVPLRELIGDARLFARRDNGNLVHYYAQAWSLVCYLQRRQGDRFAEYLRLLSRRRPGAATTAERELADFESVFGPLDQTFENRWLRYILNLRFQPSS